MIDFAKWWKRRELHLWKIYPTPSYDSAFCDVIAYARRVAHDAYKQGYKDGQDSMDRRAK